jgi:hypothetical protein
MAILLAITLGDSEACRDCNDVIPAYAIHVDGQHDTHAALIVQSVNQLVLL